MRVLMAWEYLVVVDEAQCVSRVFSGSRLIDFLESFIMVVSLRYIRESIVLPDCRGDRYFCSIKKCACV